MHIFPWHEGLRYIWVSTTKSIASRSFDLSVVGNVLHQSKYNNEQHCDLTELQSARLLQVNIKSEYFVVIASGILVLRTFWFWVLCRASKKLEEINILFASNLVDFLCTLHISYIGSYYFILIHLYLKVVYWNWTGANLIFCVVQSTSRCGTWCPCRVEKRLE